MIELLEVGNAEALRHLLDELNEAGKPDRVVGVNAHGDPFLAFLAGIYADTAWAYAYNPRDLEIDPPTGTARCGECGATDPLTLEDLIYPVTVIR